MFYHKQQCQTDGNSTCKLLQSGKNSVTYISEVDELCNKSSIRALELQRHGVLGHVRSNRFLKHVTALQTGNRL
jgi:hypothetical protein